MWQIKNPEVKPATLDFSSSEQGKLQVSQLFSDGVELINALELVDWDSEDTQFLVCESCGTPIVNLEIGSASENQIHLF